MGPGQPTHPLRDAWLGCLADPYRDDMLRAGRPDLDALSALLPRAQGEPAFDPERVQSNIERLEARVKVDAGHPLLDRSVKTGLALIDATFQASHPKYGVKNYAQTRHDGFPPTIIAAADALSAWGLCDRAEQLLTYWLDTFVCPDGDIRYYGTSLSEYGQLLHTGVRLAERAGYDRWPTSIDRGLTRLASWAMRAVGQAGDDLVSGSPEADERRNPARYFHNNAWLATGLARYAKGCRRFGAQTRWPLDPIDAAAAGLRTRTLDAIADTWPTDANDRWLAPQVEPSDRPDKLTGTRLASYTNYRYWPELLSSGVLPRELAERVVDARLHFGGQFMGMTRFMDHLDDWPLFDHMTGLWHLGRTDDFLLCLYGHVAYHQAEGHLTAYEQITLPPGRETAPYCLPCQLVPARAVALMQGR